MLGNIRILDLTEGPAGFCTKLLADLGAEVIKLEKPEGDPSRSIGPFWSGSVDPQGSFSFLYHNSNKKGITLNLEDPAGADIFLKLLSRADVVVESFAPGKLKDLGLSWEILTKSQPRLIQVSITGFGQTGPYRDFKSCDLLASASGGQMYVSGYPSGPPLKPPGPQPHYTAALNGAIGILLAMRNRARSGRGAHIDISLQEAAASSLGHVLVRYFYEKLIVHRQGKLYANNFFALLPCRDGHIALTPLHNWDTLLEWLAGEGMAGDLVEEKWQDEAYRHAHIDHILEVLERWTRLHEAGQLAGQAQLMHFPWAPVHSLADVLEDPQLKARNFFLHLSDPQGGRRIPSAGLPYVFSAQPPQAVRPAPRVGEHNREIFQEELGMSAEGNGAALFGRGSLTVETNALAGIRVLDLTWALAGPYATRMAADFGAEVIKIQTARTAKGFEDNTQGHFNNWNRNKKSITLNLGHPAARDIFLRLTAIADLVVTNFSPRVMANWNLTYRDLQRVKPGLIMLSMSAAGQTGPRKDWVGFAPTIQALSGFTYLTSHAAEDPLGLGFPYGDIVAGLYGTLALMAALEFRDRTGQGQHIDLSEYEALCTLLGPALPAEAAKEKQLPIGNAPGDFPSAPYGCYRCSGTDRWCVISITRDEEWRALRQVMGDPTWAQSEALHTLAGRQRHRAELDSRIEEWTSTQSPENILKRLQQAGVPAGLVQTAGDLVHDPQLRSRGFFVPLGHPLLGETVTDAGAIKMDGPRGRNWQRAPLLGEHNRYVFMELLGLSEEEIKDYVQQGAIR